MKAVILSRIQHNEDTVTIIVKPEEKISFVAGQFVMIELMDSNGAVHRRAYSLCGAPEDEALEITFKLNPQGKLTPLLFDKKEEDVITVEGPYGHFKLSDNVSHAVLIGGGTGIAPLMSMMRHIKARNWPIKITLFYGVRNVQSLLYQTEIEQYALDEKIEFIPVVQEADAVWQGAKGRINAEKLKESIHNNETQEFYLCGPAPMVKDLEIALSELGVSKNRIKTDKWQ